MTAAKQLRGTFRTGVHVPLPHDSGAKHVSGAAVYVDDIPEPPHTLHAALVLSPVAHGKNSAPRRDQGTQCPEHRRSHDRRGDSRVNDIAPIFPGEPLFPESLVEYAGQPVAVVAGTTLDDARASAELVELEIDPLEPILTAEEALRREFFSGPADDPGVRRRGTCAQGGAAKALGSI